MRHKEGLYDRCFIPFYLIRLEIYIKSLDSTRGGSNANEMNTEAIYLGYDMHEGTPYRLPHRKVKLRIYKNFIIMR